MGPRLAHNRRSRRAAAGLRHTGPDGTWPHTLTDVHRTGRLGDDSTRERQSTPHHTADWQRRHNHSATRHRGFRPLRSRRSNDRTSINRSAMDIQRFVTRAQGSTAATTLQHRKIPTATPTDYRKYSQHRRASRHSPHSPPPGGITAVQRIPNFRETRIAMLRADTWPELDAILNHIETDILSTND